MALWKAFPGPRKMETLIQSDDRPKKIGPDFGLPPWSPSLVLGRAGLQMDWRLLRLLHHCGPGDSLEVQTYLC